MKELSEILEYIPKYITLFYPGYITIYLYYFFSGKKFRESQWIIAKAVCISYIYAVGIKWILPVEEKDNIFLENVCLIVSCFLIGIGASSIRNAVWFEKKLKRIQKYSNYSDNEFEVLRNEDRSAWVCIYLKNSNIVYEGSLREAEDAEAENRYICLSGYYKYYLNKKGRPKKPYIENHKKDDNQKVIIHYSDISVVEKRC